jgi:hypothetical protein
MNTLKLGQRIRVFEVVKSSYSKGCFKVGGHYAEHPNSDLANNKFGAELINDSPYHSKLSIYIKDYAKQVGTLVIKKIK